MFIIASSNLERSNGFFVGAGVASFSVSFVAS